MRVPTHPPFEMVVYWLILNKLYDFVLIYVYNILVKKTQDYSEQYRVLLVLLVLRFLRKKVIAWWFKNWKNDAKLARSACPSRSSPSGCFGKNLPFLHSAPKRVFFSRKPLTACASLHWQKKHLFFIFFVSSVVLVKNFNTASQRLIFLTYQLEIESKTLKSKAPQSDASSRTAFFIKIASQ